jgi:hypothetical protein
MSVRTVSAKVVANLGWDKVKGHPSRLRRQHALCREHGAPQARVQEPADPGDCHGLDARQIDLTGACNSEHMLGHQYSASSGQLDVRGAFASRGGKSILVARATAAKGKVSCIVVRLDGPVTTPRIDTYYIVTEFGAANLKGLSSTERTNALIALAHPEFREELTKAAKQLHLICVRTIATPHQLGMRMKPDLSGNLVKVAVGTPKLLDTR